MQSYKWRKLSAYNSSMNPDSNPQPPWYQSNKCFQVSCLDWITINPLCRLVFVTKVLLCSLQAILKTIPNRSFTHCASLLSYCVSVVCKPICNCFLIVNVKCVEQHTLNAGPIAEWSKSSDDLRRGWGNSGLNLGGGMVFFEMAN